MFTAPTHRTESIQNLGQNLAHTHTGEPPERPKVSLLSGTKAALQKLRKSKKLRGEGLVSIMFYMFIVAVIILGVVSLFFSVQNSWRETSTTVLQNQLVGAVSKVYGTNRRYGTTDMIPTLYGFGALPDSAVVPGSSSGANITLQHPFGGPIKITGVTNNKYSIAFEELDADTCSTLASKTAGSTRGRSGIVSIMIGSMAITRPIDPAVINIACAAGNKTITWVYY